MAGRASFSYDVFISFRGEDTRGNFTAHLYQALVQRGIRTFLEDEMLQRGMEVGSAVVKAIEASRIAIILLSSNYAFSSFCLDELATILDCFQEKKDRWVIPIFYLIEPSDVRYQRGSYGEALARHEARFGLDSEKIKKWRSALYLVAAFPGFFFSYRDGYESEFIGKIVKEVYSMIARVPLHIADHTVGLESRMHKVISHLSLGGDDGGVHMVGIHGIGGIGKTTISLAVYNSISDHFECLCFLEDVRENTARYGLVHLQETLLSMMLGDEDINIRNLNHGISLIKQRLHRKRVLLVLDDVDSIEQLMATAGQHDWFGPGSRVIITTRSKRLLASHGVENTYEVDELSEEEALALLSWNAFKTDKVDPSYTDVLKRALTYASRLPLALEVLGSYLFGKSIEVWNDALNKFEKIPSKEIQETLKVSFDSLEDEEKSIFLDIACFFNGCKLVDVQPILCALYGLSVEYSIEVLIGKSLIKVDDGLVTLHDLIQDMGREIVRQESVKEPGRRSRLWFFEDVIQVLEDNTGSSSIESLLLDFPKDEVHSDGPKGEEIDWDGDSFKKMKNLRLLVIRNGRFNKGPSYLPHSLRVLKWRGYPSPSLPDDFHPKKLAVLKLPESCLRISEPIQGFISLTILDFSYCEWISHIPDVSGLPNLEKLSFKHCESLTEIHESVGFLDKLRILDAVHCMKLRTFPPIRLTSLEQLNLSHCSVLESFPEILGKMENITELHIMGSPMKELPFSIRNLTRLKKLELQICGMVQLPSSIVMLPELGWMCVSRCEGLWLSKQDKGEELESFSSNTEHLILSYCNISDDFLPIGLTWFANVRDLDLSGNSLTVLHACIKECHELRNLKLDDCRLLREIKGTPRKLEIFSLKGCTSLKCLDLVGECHSLRELILDDCVYLREIKGVLPNLDNFSAKNCTSLTSRCTGILLNQESVEAGNKMFSLPGTKIPDWFANRTSGESTSFWFRNKFPAISLCLVIGQVQEQPIMVRFSPRVFINGNKQYLGSRTVYEFRIATDHILLFDVQLLKFENMVFSDNKWNHAEITYVDHITNIEVPVKLVAKYSGIHVSKQTSRMGDIQFTNPPETMINANFEPHSMGGSRQSVKIATERLQNDQTMVPLLPILTSTEPPPPPPPVEVKKGLAPPPSLAIKRPVEDVSGETSDKLPEDEVYPITIHNDFPDIASSVLESEESSSNTEGSDSDDPFDLVDRKLSVSGNETMSSGASSGNASLRTIREAINSLELLMAKDLPEVSSDPTMQSELYQLLDQLNISNHPKMTKEVKEAIMEFKRKVLGSFQEFLATIESVNKLKDFEKHQAKIQQETVAGKVRRKDLKNSIKKVSLIIKAENSRKDELEAEIATLRKQLATKEKDLEQLVLNLKNQEASRATYSTSYVSLNEQARALLKEADELLTTSSGIKDEGEAAEIEQNRLKSTWSTDLTSHLKNIKTNILGLYD